MVACAPTEDIDEVQELTKDELVHVGVVLVEGPEHVVNNHLPEHLDHQLLVDLSGLRLNK